MENGTQESVTEASSHRHASQLSVIAMFVELHIRGNSTVKGPLYFSHLEIAWQIKSFSSICSKSLFKSFVFLSQNHKAGHSYC